MSSGGSGNPATRQLIIGSMSIKRAVPLTEEMAVVRGIGVEIGLCTFDGHLSQKAGLGKLMQCVVDRGQGDRDGLLHGLFVKHFRGQMAVAASEQKTRQSDALTGRPQTGIPQNLFDVFFVRFAHSNRHLNRRTTFHRAQYMQSGG